MSTGQFPKRRETDRQAIRRVEKIEESIMQTGYDYRDKYRDKERTKEKKGDAVVRDEE